MLGTCLCETIRFELNHERLRAYRCHCSLCRRQSGTHANLGVIVDADRFRWLDGQDRVRSWVRATGYRSDVCAVCGSPVPHAMQSRAAYWVPAGLLPADAAIEVVAEFHLASRAAWDGLATQGTAHEGLPGPEVLFASVAQP